MSSAVMAAAWDARPRLQSMLVSAAVAAVSTLASPAHATEPAIWYRTGEGCPDGASFLERLERRSVRGRLAAVGDRVDFVVTLGVNGERSSGRLERQTSGGTIAIREVEDLSCEAVADALALTLALTLEPEAREQPETPPAAAKAAPPAPVAIAPATTSEPSDRAETPPPDRSVPAVHPSTPSIDVTEEQAAMRLGGAIAAWDLFEGAWLSGAGLFAEIEAPRSFVLPGATLRIVLQGGWGRSADADAQLWLALGRIEACPLGLGRGALSVRPCAAVDGGAIGASAGGVDDTAVWSAAAAHARLRYEPGGLAFELQAGGIAPLTRYELTGASSGGTLEETSDIGFAAAMGVSFRLE